MIKRAYRISGQTVTCSSSEKIASDQIAFIRCCFTFPDTWDGIESRIAQFEQNGNTYEQLLDENWECDLPNELTAGTFKISVYGVSGNGTRATTTPLPDFIHQSGYSKEASSPEKLTPDLFAQLMQSIKSMVGTGGGGVGFKDWRYDEAGYLHIIDEEGEDVLPPLFVPGLSLAGLTAEQIETATALVQRAGDYAAASGQSAAQAAETERQALSHAETAAQSAEQAKNSADEAKDAKEQAASLLTNVSGDMELARRYSETALESSRTAGEAQRKSETAAESAERSAQNALEALAGFETDKTLSVPEKAADAKETGDKLSALNQLIGKHTEELSKRFSHVVIQNLPDVGETDTLYLVPSDDETVLLYLYRNGAWEMVGGSGSGTLDEEALAAVLSGYYKKTEVDELFDTVPSAEEVERHTTDIEELKEQLDAVGVSIQSVDDDDGVTRQYLVDINGNRLGDAIVGTGGGGGGGSTATSVISVIMSDKNPSSVEFGKPCPVSFWWTSLYNDGGSTGNGSITFSVKSGTVTTRCATQTLAQAAVGMNPITFDFGPWMRSGANTLIIQITDSEGNVASRRLTVTAQVLGLEVDYDWTTVNAEDASIRWRVSGSSGVTFHATVANQPVATVKNPTVGRWQTLSIPHREHGTYRLRLWTDLGMDDGSVITSSITGFDLMFTDDGNGKCLIASDFSAEEPLQQYTAQSVRYFVYNPMAVATDITRLVDTEIYAVDTAVERQLQEWKWKPTQSGQHTIGIRAGEGDNQTTRNFVVTVSGVNIPDSVKEVGKYAMKFSPSGHQNSDADPLAGICTDSDGNEISCTVNDGFDWTNGGIQYDSLGNAYFCIMSGDRLMIDYAPFAVDCKPAGRHIKVCFNTTEVANRSAPWLNCMDAAENGNAVGLVMTPTSATITSEQSQTLTTRYMYDRGTIFDLPTVEMDLNIQKSSQERLIQFWMGGCPAQVIQYTTDDGFAQNDASKLVIGSDECEVHIYMIKIADNSWEDEEITDDWIMNAPSGEEMVARYQRNDIYSMDGTLNFDALPEKLVKVVVHADQWTTGKSSSNYITGTVDIYIDGKHGTADCRFKGQGTSSMGYIGAGLNIDIDLRSEVTWDDGTTTIGIQLSENAIPVTYLNYKVNIASSESYKNMLYAHDYQLFQPYIRPARAANPAVRDTMEFRMGVLCFRNTSEETVWAGNTPYAPGIPSLYAVGNLGNSKKNNAALGEGVTEQYRDTECLIECTENTTKYQLMHEPVPDDDAITFPDENTAFEFRYPDGDGTELMKSNFRRMQRWVASTCTEEEYITGDELDEPYIVRNGKVQYRIGSNGAAVTVYDSQSRPRKVVENCQYDTEVIEVDGEYYNVLPLDAEGKEITGFTHDTEAYRLGKFLQEFDDYFIFDSIAYHYHVTHQFEMVDNRAKNTFYGTEDGQHWHLVKAYDGDTQMGNNNSGDLTLDYGLEDIDKLGGGYVFNGARHTLWVNMRKLYDKNSPYYDAAFYNRMQASYQAAETRGAWDAKRRLKLIQSWVSLVPEVLWRDDARKKYLNPLLNGDDASYLAKANGNCLDQVAQFCAEQQPYGASMWQTSANRENLVTMRGYTPAEYPAGYTPSSEISLKAFSKCYLTVDYDGDIQKPVRLNAGESATFTQGDVKLNDTPVYIPGAQLISEMSPVSRLYPGYCNFNYLSNCQRIEVGEGGGYSNPNLTALAVGGCKKLRYLDAQNTPNLSGTIDVSNSRELRTVLAQGSGASGVAFADGGKLETYHGGGNVASLVARNLRSVQAFDLQAYDKVSRVNIEGSPSVDTRDIVDKAQNVSRVRLTGIEWRLESVDLLKRLYNLRGLDAGGNDTDRSVLTGQVHIERALQSELARFHAAWPLLEITCEEEVPEYTVIYKHEDGTELFRETYEGGAVWHDPVASGALEAPTKPFDERVDYKYMGWDSQPSIITGPLVLTATFTAIPVFIVKWMQDDSETVIYSKRFPQGARYEDPVQTGEIELPTKEPDVSYTYTFKAWDYTPDIVNMDMSIFATYSRTTRRYTVTWYDYSGRVVQELSCVAHGSVQYTGQLNLTRPSTQAGVRYLWLGDWDADTSDVVSDMELHPVFLECQLPKPASVPAGWYLYSDNPDDPMLFSRSEFAAIMLSDREVVEQYVTVGDRIKICMNTNVITDTEIVLSLHSTKHYRLVDEPANFANTSWFMTGVLNANRQMNTSNTNVGGWKQSAMRDWMNKTLYPAFPLFWKCLMKQVTVLSSIGSGSATIEESEDYLYLPSYAEMGLDISAAPYKNEVDAGANELMFMFYTGNNQRIKKTYNGEGSAQNYWTRSPYSGSSSSFCYITGNGGGANATGAAGSVAVCVGLSL